MEGKMQGYAIVGKDQCEWKEFDIPTVGPNGALIKIEIVSICTTDTHFIETGCEALPYLLGKATGHEAAGVVAEVGENVKLFKPGDRVAMCANIPDWRGTTSQDGWPNIAGMDLYEGFDPGEGHQGTCADYYYIDDADANLAHVPDNVTMEQACMMADMVTTGFRGTEAADIQFGQTVVILGVGPVGLFALRAAALKGAGKIIAVGSRPNTFEVAKEFGAHHCVDYHDENWTDKVIEFNGGNPVDAVVVCGGGPRQLQDANHIAKWGATIANVAAWLADEEVSLNIADLGFGYGSKTFKFVQCLGGRVRMEHLLSLIANGSVQPEKVITNVYHGKEHVIDAINLFLNHDRNFIKPVVYWE